MNPTFTMMDKDGSNSVDLGASDAGICAGL